MDHADRATEGVVVVYNESGPGTDVVVVVIKSFSVVSTMTVVVVVMVRVSTPIPFGTDAIWLEIITVGDKDEGKERTMRSVENDRM